MWMNTSPKNSRVGTSIFGLFLAFFVAASSAGAADSPLYRVDLPPERTLEEVEISIESKARGLNLANVGTLDVAEGMRNRGIAYDQVYKVYQVCNLGLGAEVLRDIPAFGAFIPCKVVVFEEDDHLAMITYRPSYALRYFPDAPREAKRIAEEIEADIIELMNAVKSGGF